MARHVGCGGSSTWDWFGGVHDRRGVQEASGIRIVVEEDLRFAVGERLVAPS
jgi:hypothetical protein